MNCMFHYNKYLLEKIRVVGFTLNAASPLIFKIMCCLYRALLCMCVCIVRQEESECDSDQSFLRRPGVYHRRTS